MTTHSTPARADGAKPVGLKFYVDPVDLARFKTAWQDMPLTTRPKSFSAFVVQTLALRVEALEAERS